MHSSFLALFMKISSAVIVNCMVSLRVVHISRRIPINCKYYYTQLHQYSNWVVFGILGILELAMLVGHISQVFHTGLLVFTILCVLLDKVSRPMYYNVTCYSLLLGHSHPADPTPSDFCQKGFTIRDSIARASPTWYYIPSFVRPIEPLCDPKSTCGIH